MPNFYDSSIPTSISHNTINSTIINYGIRDYLLNLNLLPQYPSLGTSINGSPRIGEPVLDTMVGTGAVTAPDGLPLNVYGIIRKNIAVLPNQFIDNSLTSNALTDINYLPVVGNPYPNSTAPLGSNTYNNINYDVYGLINKMEEGQYRKNATVKNLYLDESLQVNMADYLALQPVLTSQQLTNYVDVFGGLNQGGTEGEQGINVLGSLINGQGFGFGFGSSGIIPNFDIRASLAGRVLGASGILNDTRLGIIGGQQLALALANNAAFNTEQLLLGTLDVEDNVLSLIRGGHLSGLRPSYKITVPESGVGRAFADIGGILGFTLPKSFLDDSGSIFQDENKNAENIARANSMIKNTGRGQALALINNVSENLNVNSTTNPFRSGYSPAFTNNKGNYDSESISIIDSNLYAYSNGEGGFIHLLSSDEGGGVMPNLNFLREKKTESSGFLSPEANGTGPFGNSGYDTRTIKDIGFTWTSNVGGAVNNIPDNDIMIGDKKSLLVKTQKLFNSIGMKNIVSTKGDMGKNSSQLSQANGGGYSKGSGVIRGDRFSQNGDFDGQKKTAEETYCRSWTPLDRYDSVTKLVRSGIDNISSNVDSISEFNGDGINNKVPYRFETNNSVIGGYGFPKITPYSTDKPDDPKKFMLSIENLAWNDDVPNLPQSEQGPGDLTTGKRGRIMWFPPYDISFSENNSINWEPTNFIGRGESVYTYNNTERSGSLNFKIVVDHPTYINSFRGVNGPSDNYVASYFAGCIDPNDVMSKKLTVSEISNIVNELKTEPQKLTVTPEPEPPAITVYFPNDNIIIPVLYENGKNKTTGLPINYSTNPFGEGQGLGQFPGNYTLGSTENWPDNTNFGLNVIDYDIDGVPYSGINTDSPLWVGLDDFLTNKCPNCKIKVKGFASPQGRGDSNIRLAKDRAQAYIDFLKQKVFQNLTEEDRNKHFYPATSEAITVSGCKPSSKTNKEPVDTLDCKKDRRTEITCIWDSNLAAENMGPAPVLIKSVDKRITTTITNRLYDETKYFEQLTDADPFVFDSFRKKIKYFHPAFHSITPEGLNSRLTFLLQCTRQGRTLETQGANNLAFGRPPVCILRIGDFYNTKIVMDNVSIDYEPLVWDLNPEGIGVQPMIASVSISFKFIGGSTLMGPINKLQNALSFNYFANSQVYDPRADYLSVIAPEIKNFNPDGTESGTSTIGTSKTDWFITNLVNDKYNGNVNKLNTTETNSTTIPSDVDQTATSANLKDVIGETNVTPIPDATTATASNEEVLNQFSLGGYQQITESSTSIDLDMIYQPKKDIPAIISGNKTYKFFLYLTRLNSSEKTNLGGFEVKRNDGTSLSVVGTTTNTVNGLSTTLQVWITTVSLDTTGITTLLKAQADITNERYSLSIEANVAGVAAKSVGYNSAIT